MTIHSIRMMTTPVTTPERQRPYQLTQLLTSARCVSWHRVIHASRWCLAVINASVSCMPAKCTTLDAAVLFAARLSTYCCVCTNLPPLQSAPAFSTPAFSIPAIYSRIFHFCNFHPCNYARATFSTPAFSVAPPIGRKA